MIDLHLISSGISKVKEETDANVASVPETACDELFKRKTESLRWCIVVMTGVLASTTLSSCLHGRSAPRVDAIANAGDSSLAPESVREQSNLGVDVTGVTSSEIKIGQSMVYSGPASAYGTIGRAETAYFKMINDKGGIHGRTINLISLDDGYNPARAIEHTRELVENEHVAFMFNSIGTANNIAVQKYLNDKKVPQLFVATGADRWGDPEHFPWTIGWQPSYRLESRIYAKYIMKEKSGAKMCVLYQNDDFGNDYLKGLHEAFGDSR